MTQDGVLASMTLQAPTDREFFLAYLDQALYPALRPSQEAVMGNLSAHKVEGVRQRIEEAGDELLYLLGTMPQLGFPIAVTVYSTC